MHLSTPNSYSSNKLVVNKFKLIMRIIVQTIAIILPQNTYDLLYNHILVLSLILQQSSLL